MKQERCIMRRVPINTSKGVSNSTRSKLKLPTLPTPLKYAPLTAKVNTTWNNVVNKNKDIYIGSKTLSSNKCENIVQVNDPVRTLRFQINELKTKIEVLLPGNRDIRNIMENILKTFSRIEQPVVFQNTFNNTSLIRSQIINEQLPAKSVKSIKEINIDELRQRNEKLDSNLKESLEKNEKLKTEKESKESQLITLKNELSSSKKCIEKLESALNESVNTERETIANYEQQCKRLQNEIKTLQDSASQKEYSATSCGKNLSLISKQEAERIIAVDKFKYQIELALKGLEKEKFLSLLKYDEIQINAAHCEFCNIYELIQNYFQSDHDQRMQCILNSQTDKLDKKKRK